MVADEFPKAGVRESLRHVAEMQDLGHHQKHDQTAVGIDGREAKGRPDAGDRIH